MSETLDVRWEKGEGRDEVRGASENSEFRKQKSLLQKDI